MIETMAEAPFFKRIRIATKEDVVACYPLVAAYIRNPEAANSVTELIIDLPSRHCYPYTKLSPPLSTTSTHPSALDDDAHRSIIDYTNSLGLDADTTAVMSQALEDKKKPPPTEQQEGPRAAKRFRWGLREDTSEYNATITTLLISLLPNLTTLRFFNVGRSSPLDRFLEANNSGALPRSYLQKLEAVQLQRVNCEDERNYDHIRDMRRFRYFYKLPAVRTLSMEGFEDYQADYEDFPIRMSEIRRVHIGHCDMSWSMVGRVLGIPRVLEEFSYSSFGLMNTDGGCSTVSHESVGKGLYKRRKELRRLDLDMSVCAGGEEEDGEGKEEDDSSSPREYPSRSIGRLDEFESLTHLSIRIGLLLGYRDVSAGTKRTTPSASYRLVEALPPNLEFLRLYGYQKGRVAIIDDQVTELLEKKSSLFPNLVEMHGVDELIPGVPGTWDPEPGEDNVWKRSTENLDWEFVSPAQN
ncbi:hypothetical protein QBC34DRAFT_165623 [Podospora aff. communis PSN243]|uniref:F-box domain-containing protein n=1 Tax=Podospora aff. communis PSN243 TaxID=3040156 RepID=A0AAV9GBN6_9PEZI|nr:hypothetical protein QBC34DRAFT_165623 [Podospora aff. communis PSN243]